MSLVVTFPVFVPNEAEVEAARDKIRETWLNLRPSPVPVVMLVMNDTDGKVAEKYNHPEDNFFVFNCKPFLHTSAHEMMNQIVIKASPDGVNNMVYIADDDFNIKPEFRDYLENIKDSTEYRYLNGTTRYQFTAGKNKDVFMKIFTKVEGKENEYKWIPKGVKPWEEYGMDYMKIGQSLWTCEGIICPAGYSEWSRRALYEIMNCAADEKALEIWMRFQVSGLDIMHNMYQAYLHGIKVERVRGVKHESARPGQAVNISTCHKFNEDFPEECESPMIKLAKAGDDLNAKLAIVQAELKEVLNSVDDVVEANKSNFDALSHVLWGSNNG